MRRLICSFVSRIEAHIPVVRGHRLHFPNYFVGLKVVLILANNADPGEMLNNVRS